MLTKIYTYALAHTFLSALAILVVLGVGWYSYSHFTAPSTLPRYVVSPVATGTLVATLTESGQVSAVNQIDLQSKSSGEVTTVAVKAGDHVAAGAVIAAVDPTSAEANYESAQIAFEKLTEAAATSTRTNAENALASAEANLASAHQNGYNDVTSAFLTIPNVISGLDATLHNDSTIAGHSSQQNENAYSDLTSSYDSTVTSYELAAESAYHTAYATYQSALAEFKTTPRDADDATIEKLVRDSYQAAADLSNALKTASNFLNLVSTTLSTRQLQIPSVLTSQIASLTSYTSQVNSAVVTLSSDANLVVSDERSLAAAQASLDELVAGPNPLDVKSSQLSLAQARQSLADTVVRAPFAGVIAKMDIQKYQTIGNGTTVATIVNAHQSAQISLNEVDAAKISTGQKATLTFDALTGVTIAGTVSSIDTLGAVSQGVVTYGATITFDTDNAAVKPGMSVNASIVTASKENVLVVPTSAVKTANGQSYVQVFTPPLASTAGTQGIASSEIPMNVLVVTGLSNDTQTEIVSGLSAGMQVVTRTTTGTATTATTPAAGSARGGAGGFGAGAIRL